MMSPHGVDVAASAGPSTDHDVGLLAGEARERLARYGANAISDNAVPAWKQLASTFWAPVPWMLETVIVLQLLLGRRLEALVIAALLLFNAVVAFVQERRASDALALLRKQLHVNARVLRDGLWRQLPAEQLVPGDVVHIRAGDLVPADLLLFDGAVALDQSALTGESLPVDASTGQPALPAPLSGRARPAVMSSPPGRTPSSGAPRNSYARQARPATCSRPFLRSSSGW